jgi:hypothetical protein
MVGDKCLEASGAGTATAYMPTLSTGGKTSLKLEFQVTVVGNPTLNLQFRHHIGDSVNEGGDGLPGGNGSIAPWDYTALGRTRTITVDLSAIQSSFDPIRLFFGYTGAAGESVQIDTVILSSTVADAPVFVPNRPPTANAVTAQGQEDLPTPVNLSGTDPDGGSVNLSVASQPANGTLSGSPPTLMYTPKKDFSGTDTFTFTAADQEFVSAPATATINVAAVNDKPVITMPKEADTRQGVPITFNSAFKRTVTVADVESEAENLPVDFYIAAASAPITLQGDMSGLTLTTGDGTDDTSIRGSGTIPAINAALSSAVITPRKEFTGTANYTVGITDRGQTGLGGPMTTEEHTEIEVSGGPDAYVALVDRAKASQTGFNVFDDTGATQILSTDAIFGGFTRLDWTVATAGLIPQKVTFKAEATGDLINAYYRNEFGDDITKEIVDGTFERTVTPTYGARNVRMIFNLARTPTTPDEEATIKLTATSVPEPNTLQKAESDVILIKIKPRAYKPDLLISSTTQGAAVGDDRYEAAFAQNTQPPSSHTQSIEIKALMAGGNAEGVNVFIQNDGTSPEEFTLQGSGVSPGVKVVYYNDFSQDITSQITSGTFKTPLLDPIALGGKPYKVRMVLLADATAVYDGTHWAQLRTADAGQADGDIVSVKWEIATDRQPDLYVFSEQDPQRRLTGWEVFKPHFGVASTVIEEGEIGATSHYEVWLGNTNKTKKGQFAFGAGSTQPGYIAKWMQIEVRNGLPEKVDITNQIKSGKFVLDLGPQHYARFYLDITVTKEAKPTGFANQLKMSALAIDGLPRNQDHAIIEMSANSYTPDLRIMNGGAGTGNNVYGIGGSLQTLKVEAGSGELVSQRFRIENDGAGDPATYKIQGNGTTTDGYTVSYRNGKGQDITSAVVAGTHQVTLKPGFNTLINDNYEYEFVEALVTLPSDSGTKLSKLISLTATSMQSHQVPPASDTVTMTTALGYRPDLIALNAGGSPFYQGLFTRTKPTTAGPTYEADIGKRTTTKVRVFNAGTQPDSYSITTVPSAPIEVKKVGTTDGTSFTTPIVAPGASYEVPVVVKLPTTVKGETQHTVVVNVASKTRPASNGDTVGISLTAKMRCLTAPVSFDAVRITGECIQDTEDGWLVSKTVTINKLDFKLGTNVGFIDKTAKTLVVSSADIFYTGTTTKIYSGPVDLTLGPKDTLNGSGTTSKVMGLDIGAGPVKISMLTAGESAVELPLRPIAVFGSGQASEPFLVPATGAAPPTTPPAGTTMTFPSLQLGPIGVGDVITKYDAASQTWLGYGRAGFPNLPVPKLPAVEVAMQAKGGTLNWAYLKMKAGVAGIQVGPMTVNKFDAQVKLNPTQVIGNIGADLAPTPVTLPGKTEKKLPLFSVEGKFLVSNYKMSVKGAAKLLGFLEFGSFQATYEYGGVMRMTAVLNHSIDIGIGTLGVRAEIDGSVDSSSGRFQILGSGTASVGPVSAGIDAVLSSRGLAACGKVKILGTTHGVGLGMKWSNASISGFTGCNLDDYKDVNAPAHVDFDKISTDTEALLTQADPIRAQLASASAALRSIGLPSLSDL